MFSIYMGVIAGIFSLQVAFFIIKQTVYVYIEYFLIIYKLRYAFVKLIYTLIVKSTISI